MSGKTIDRRQQPSDDIFDVREDEHFSLSGIEPETMVWNVDNIHRVVSHELNGTIGAFRKDIGRHTSDRIQPP